MIKFGTLGAARITPLALVQPCKDEPKAGIHVVTARSRARADEFASEHDIPHVVNTYQEVVDHPDINAVYVPLPITAHKEWTLKALAAGKHVLCEKSFAANASEARNMAEAAEGTGLVLMDAFHYRYHPLFSRAREIYLSGVLGSVDQVEAKLHVAVTDTSDIRMNYESGGGVTMDIGCYPVSWLRHMIGAEPLRVTAEAEIGPPDVDVWLKAQMEFPGNIKGIAEGDMRAEAKFKAFIKVIGSDGTMTVNNPIAPHLGNSIDLTIRGEITHEKFDRRPTYSFQLDAFIDCVENGTQPLTGAADAVKQMELIDWCYEAAGLKLRGM
jgi:predicted dehydrogenase